jgi:hypothetical protein
MPSIIIIDKSGNIKSQSAKSLTVNDFYKKAGLKTPDGFKKYAEWNVNISDTDYNIHLYGKTNGRANQENKYEFPPPVDSTLFFGSCVLANMNGDSIGDLSEDEWDNIYEFLYGGFEDLGDEDTCDETLSEEEIAPKTKQGYAKDGFVVDDDDEEYMDDSMSSDESFHETKPKRKNAKEASLQQSSIYCCSNELEEEDYV